MCGSAPRRSGKPMTQGCLCRGAKSWLRVLTAGWVPQLESFPPLLPLASRVFVLHKPHLTILLRVVRDPLSRSIANMSNNTGMENQPRTSCRLPQHPKSYLRRRWLCRLGREIPHQRPSCLRPRLSCLVHAQYAHQTVTRRAEALPPRLCNL
jgi:hypothetical protein